MGYKQDYEDMREREHAEWSSAMEALREDMVADFAAERKRVNKLLDQADSDRCWTLTVYVISLVMIFILNIIVWWFR
jgi:hypothetical protein